MANDNNNIAAATKEIESTASKAKASELGFTRSYANYAQSVSGTMDSLRSTKDSLDDLKAAAEKNDAEKAAAEATVQGAISVADALELMKAEEEAKAKYRKASSEYLNKASEAFSSTLKNGASLLAMTGDDLLDGFVDSALTPGGMGFMAAGAGAAIAFLPGPIRDSAHSMLSGYLELADKNGTDVEEKHVEGYETPEDAAKSAIEDNYDPGNGSSSDSRTTGADANGEKQVPGDPGRKLESEDDALTITEEEMDDIANIGSKGVPSEYSEVPGTKFLEAISEGAEWAANPLGHAVEFVKGHGVEVYQKLAGVVEEIKKGDEEKEKQSSTDEPSK